MLFLYDVQEAADKNGGAEEQKKKTWRHAEGL